MASRCLPARRRCRAQAAFREPRLGAARGARFALDSSFLLGATELREQQVQCRSRCHQGATISPVTISQLAAAAAAAGHVRLLDSFPKCDSLRKTVEKAVE